MKLEGHLLLDSHDSNTARDMTTLKSQILSFCLEAIIFILLFVAFFNNIRYVILRLLSWDD